MAKKLKASKKRRKNRLNKNRKKRSAESVVYEVLEPKHLLAAVTVGNATDLSNGDTSSFTALINNDGGDGISLREAISAANNTAQEDSITFDQNVFTGGDDNLIRLTQGELAITESLSIDGTSVGSVVITGDRLGNDIRLPGTNITDVVSSSGGQLNDNSRVLNFSAPTGNLTLSSLTITGGHTTGSAGAGGGIFFGSSETITLNRSTISGNSATGSQGRGGGIATTEGSVSLMNSTVNGNTANTTGGGISARNSGVVSLMNSTVSSNSSNDGGGGISSFNASTS